MLKCKCWFALLERAFNFARAPKVANIMLEQIYYKNLQSPYPGQSVFGIQQRQLVSAEAFHLFKNQRKVLARLDAQFVLQRSHDVLDFGRGIILERFGLSVFQENF